MLTRAQEVRGKWGGGRELTPADIGVALPRSNLLDKIDSIIPETRGTHLRGKTGYTQRINLGGWF